MTSGSSKLAFQFVNPLCFQAEFRPFCGRQPSKDFVLPSLVLIYGAVSVRIGNCVWIMMTFNGK
jgi:hypothetical protein